MLGQPKDEAQATLESAGFEVELEKEESDEPKGQVVETDPAHGETVPRAATVTVFFSDGPEEVPDVVGLTAGGGRADAIRDAGFEPSRRRTTDTTEPAGTVIEQSPAAGERRRRARRSRSWSRLRGADRDADARPRRETPTGPTPTDAASAGALTRLGASRSAGAQRRLA